MKPCTSKDSTESLKRFRQQLYDSFPARRDACMNPVDSLCANTLADSVVELSLNAPFERGYGSLTDAIDQFALGDDGPERTALARLVASNSKFWKISVMDQWLKYRSRIAAKR